MSLSPNTRKLLGDRSGFNLSKLEDDTLNRQITNAQTRLSSVGVDPEEKKDNSNFLVKALDILSRTGYGANNLIREFSNKEAGSTPGVFDPLSAFVRGIRGQDRAQGRDIMTDIGLSDEEGIFGGEKKWYNPSAAGALGLALDIVNPLDPLNWVGFGVGDDIVKGSSRGLNALSDAFGASRAARISEILNNTGKTASLAEKSMDLAKAAKPVAEVVDNVKDLGAESVGKLISQVMAKADAVNGADEISRLIGEGLREKGLTATSKLDFKAMKPLQVGLQNPLSIGSDVSVKLPGYKATGGKAKLPIMYLGKDIEKTFVNIPGSEYVTNIVSGIAKRVSETRFGQTLGKAFSTAFVPNTVPNSVIKKDLTASNMRDLVSLSQTKPESVPLTAQELIKLHDDLANVSIKTKFDFADSFTATDLKKVNKGEYLSLNSLAKQVGLRGLPVEDMVKVLNDTPFQKNILEIYDSLKVSLPTVNEKELFTRAAKLRKVLDLMYEQVPEGLKPLFTGVVRAQASDIYPKGMANGRLGKNLSSSPLLAYEFNYKGVPISTVVNSGEGFNDNVWGKLSSALEALDELPENAIQALKGSIDISPIPLKNPDTSMTVGDTIVLGRIDKPTVAHEYGHIWDSVAGDTDLYSKAILGDASKIDDVITSNDLYSDYARTLYDNDNALGIKEDLADSVSDYLSDRKLFSSKYPNRSKEIERMLEQSSIPNDQLAKLVSDQRAKSQKAMSLPKTEEQIKTMMDSVDKYVYDLKFEPGAKTYESFHQNLASLFEQTNWKTKQWQDQVNTLFKGLSDNERKQIMDAAAQITGTEIPGMTKPASEPLFSKQDFPVFMSKLEEVTNGMSNAMPVDQFRAYLKSHGVKDEEIKWTFMDDLLDGKDKVTKQEVQDWVAGNKLEVNEIWRTNNNLDFSSMRSVMEDNDLSGEDIKKYIQEYKDSGIPDSEITGRLIEAFDLGPNEADYILKHYEDPGVMYHDVINSDGDKTKFSRYTQPGGEGYTELIFTLPEDYNVPKGTVAESKPSFTAPYHWDDTPNPVAHTRFDTRYTDDGRKILFIDEIQSDWHQQGRDRGYKGSEVDISEWSIVGGPKHKQELPSGYADVYLMTKGDKRISINARSDEEAFEKLRVKLMEELIPDAPFKSNWDEFVQKRLLRYAADNGYDGIAWSTGKQQAERWSQSVTENIDTLQYNHEGGLLRAYKNGEQVLTQQVPPESLPDVVGKDVARSLLDTSPDTYTIKPVNESSSYDLYEEKALKETEGMDPVAMSRYLDKNSFNPTPTGFKVYDQNGNSWAYVYPTQQEAEKAIEGLATVGDTMKTVSGINITVGGEGMRKFYDQQVPSNFKKLGKKFGLSIDEVDLDFSGSAGSNLALEEPEGIYDAILEYTYEYETSTITNKNLAENVTARLNYSHSEGTPITEADVGKLIDEYINQAKLIKQDMGGEYKLGKLDPNKIKAKVLSGIDFELDQKSLSKQQGIWLTPESRMKINQYSFPLFANQKSPEVPNLTDGWSDRQVNALSEFLKWRDSVVKQYRQIGIPINELEKYVPFIPTRVLNKYEAETVRTVFGTGSKDTSVDFDPLMAELTKYDPNLKGRTTKASRPSEVNELLRKPWLTEDAAVAMSIRGSRAIKAKEFSDFSDEFLRTYGLSMSDLGKEAIGNTIPNGYSAYRVAKDASGVKKFQAVNSIPSVVDSGSDVIFLPTEMVNLYNEYSKVMFNPEARNGVLDVYDAVNRAYKKTAYLWNPGHIARDFQGNVFNNYLMGVVNPVDYSEGLRVMKNADGSLKTPNGDLPYREIKEQAEKLGIIDSETTYEVPVKLGKPEGKYTQMMRKGTLSVDGWTRSTGFVHNLKKGMSYSEAAATTKKYLFDYMDLTPFERKVMRRIVPFYTWVRKNIPLQLEMLLKNPRAFARVDDVQNAVAGEDIDWGSKPDYIQDSMAVQPANSGMYISASLPYSDLSKVPMGADMDALGNLLSSVSPIIRAPIESITNQKWWTGRPLEEYAGEKTDIPVLTTLMELLGASSGPRVDARVTGNLIDNIPMLNRAGNLLDSLSGKETSDVKNLSRLSTTLGGPSFFDASSVETSSAWDERQRLLDLIRLIEDSGTDVPTTRELKSPKKESKYRRLKSIIRGGN